MRLTQLQLAAALGISQPAVSQLVAQGMPAASIEAAQAWRKANLNPARAKFPPEPPRLLGLLQDAEARIAAGEDIAPLLPALRRALRQVPADQRANVAMSVALWDALTNPIGSTIERETATLTTAEAEEMGVFWYALAAGEPWTP